MKRSNFFPVFMLFILSFNLAVGSLSLAHNGFDWLPKNRRHSDLVRRYTVKDYPSLGLHYKEVAAVYKDHDGTTCGSYYHYPIVEDTWHASAFPSRNLAYGTAEVSNEDQAIAFVRRYCIADTIDNALSGDAGSEVEHIKTTSK